MDDFDFDYDKAEADLYDSGCFDSEEIYGYRSEKGINEFMRENGLNPDNYYKHSGGSGSSNNSNSGGCYLTSAWVNAKNLPDDCEELTVLRNYRDTYLKQREGGAEDIKHYYEFAPKIVEAIDKLPNAVSIWEKLYNDMILPCVAFIKDSQFEAAYELYKKFTLQLEGEYVA